MTRLRARRALAAAGFVLVAVEALAAVSASSQTKVDPGPVPRATCGPGSHPETGMQGRIPPTDIASGRADSGYDCNVSLVGLLKTGNAGWKVARYGTCAYFNGDPGGLPLGLTTTSVPGTYVADVSDPARPTVTDVLRTPAMSSPHESMALDARRGLLMATLANFFTAPGVLEIYDIKTDCRHPRLISTLPSAVLGHEGNLSSDGLTYYSGSLYAETLTAVDVSNPLAPLPLVVENIESHGMATNADGTRLYDTYAEYSGDGGGLIIYDATRVQNREPNAGLELISRLSWPERSTPQFVVPITVKGRPYLLETDEFGGEDSGTKRPVGAARIIDISNEKAPVVVSNIRLEVHMPEAQARFAADGDVVPLYGGPYTGHYCSVPTQVDPGIVACSMLRSGLRIFDIRDPRKPKEIAYYNPPAAHDLADTSGGSARLHIGANVEFVPERGEIWVAVQDSGLHVIRLTNGVWPFTGAPPRPALREPRPLPATGTPVASRVAAGLALLVAGGVMVEASRRPGRTSDDAAGA
ncbi:MAG TPA: hypothetical protein VNA12_10195 [Mycobacteriales bacterium]|nr:hypothetical protein [Mycobacteriales bacterium]